MTLKEKVLKIYWMMPNGFRKPLFSIFSYLMEFLKPLIVLKVKKGKFLNKRIKSIDSIDISFKFINSFHFLGFSIKIGQIKDEIIQLLKILKSAQPKIIIEIGTAGGETLFLFTRIAHPNATIVSIDLPRGPFGGGYAKWKYPIYSSFVRQKQQLKLIRANSHDPETFTILKNFLNDNLIDFLFIDGDHTYEGVKMDFEMYSILVKKGGIIAFHDIVEHSKDGSCQVNRFWDEIKDNYRSLEIIQDKNQKWAGIGLIYY